MKPYMMIGCCVVLILTMINIPVFAGEKPTELVIPTGTMTLVAPEGSDPAPKLSPVVFPHSLHFQYSCKDCHHTWNGADPIQSCATSGCHDELWADPPGSTPEGETDVKSLAGAFHQVCRDCHRAEKKQQKAAGSKEIHTGPIACEGCHPTPHSEIENSEETIAVPLGNMLIEAPEGADVKRQPVDFPHGGHFDYACQSCHHEWDGESDVVGCADCHDQAEPDPSTRNIKAEENVMYFLAAYHNTCIPCHRETTKKRNNMAKAGIAEKDLPAAGPVACNACHK